MSGLWAPPLGRGDDGMSEINARIRQVRTARGVSQHRLAALTGLSTSTVSNIELRDQTVTVPTLLRIAAALDAAPLTFLAEEQTPAVEKVPPGRRLVYQGDGFIAERLTARPDDAGLQLLLVTYEAGAAHVWAEPHPGWQYLYVLNGEIEFQVEDRDPVRLTKDDFFSFRSDRRRALRVRKRTQMILMGFGVELFPAGR
jgi:transcriptional regulator with XRE-family HTH domain